jgi:hypothetical protein
VQPNVIEPGGYAIGFVYGGANELEGVTASVDDPAIDYTEGLGDYENIVQLDVEELEATDGGFTGQLANPHDLEVGGPIDVTIACLDGDGVVTEIFSTFADRDDIEAGGSSSFTANIYSDQPDCAGLIAGTSGYTDIP